MDATDNKAAIGLSIGGAPGFQFLNLGTTPAFEPPLASPSGKISEDPLIDPIQHQLLSAAENDNYEIVDVVTSTAPKFYENPGIPVTFGPRGHRPIIVARVGVRCLSL
jgi:hypothetical protein